MKDLMAVRYFVETGKSHERENLTELVFKDLDYTTLDSPISFFRSDFMRSRFYSCTFHRNSFDRADFIDVYIKACDFSSVDFGACLFKNAVIEKVNFKNNTYNGVAIQYSYFKNCVFRDENFITNMYNCDFRECTFINCTFKKSSLDCNTFSYCEFIKVDMSECIKDNSKFDSCTLRDVYLCANLWATYLYKKTDIYQFGFKYRGNVVDIWSGDPAEFIKELLDHGLYFEYVNSSIVGKLIKPDMVLDLIQNILPSILEQPEILRRKNMLRILDMLCFYINDERIAFKDYLALYSLFASFDWKGLPPEEVLEYQISIYRLQKTIEQFDFDISYIKKIPQSEICIAKFHMAIDDAEDAKMHLRKAYVAANNEFCEGIFPEPLFTVLQVEQGSVILTIAAASLLTVLVSCAAKKVMHNINSIRVENVFTQQFVRKLSSSQNLAELKKGCKLAQEHRFLSDENDIKHMAKLSSELTKGEIIDIILSFLF